jgi:hypothetical protein
MSITKANIDQVLNLSKEIADANQPLTFIFSGQSNMDNILVGNNGGGDTTSNSNVTVWSDVTNEWVVANLNTYPIGDRTVFGGGSQNDGNNNIAFHTSKRIQEITGRPVRFILSAEGGTAIQSWLLTSVGGDQIEWNKLTTLITASGITKIDGFFWHQGESNGLIPAAEYVIGINQLRDQLLNLNLGVKIPFIASEINTQFALNDKFFKYPEYNKLVTDQWFTVVQDTPDLIYFDGIHLDGAGLVSKSNGYASSWLNTPKSTEVQDKGVAMQIPTTTGSNVMSEYWNNGGTAGSAQRSAYNGGALGIFVMDGTNLKMVSGVAVKDFEGKPAVASFYNPDGSYSLYQALAGNAVATQPFKLNANGTVTIGTNTFPSTDGLPNQSLRTDGSGNLVWSSNIDTEIIVQQASQLSGVLSSDKVYVIDGVIDLGAVEITVPEGGLFIRGIDYFVSGLISTADNHTMFKNGAGAYTGNFKMSDIFMTSSGTNSKLFDLDNQQNFGAIEFESCNLGDFSDATTSLGELSNYRQFRTNDCGFFRVQDGLTFSGTWAGGFRINDTIVLSQLAGSTLFKPSVGLTFAGRCISDINAASVDPTTITFDFIPSNFLLDGGFQLSSASFAPNSAISVTTDETNIKAFFRDCVEIRNTRAGFNMEWSTETITPLTLDTPTKALGSTTTFNNTWFTQTANNEVTYDSSLSKDARIAVNVTVDGGANDEINLIIRHWDNSASAYIDVKNKVRSIANLVGGLDVASYTFVTRVNDLALNDRIEIWLENTTDSTDATILNGSEINVEIM